MVEISSSEMSKLILIVFFSGVNRHNPKGKKYFHVIAKSCFKSKFRGRTIDIDTNENRKMQKLTKKTIPIALLHFNSVSFYHPFVKLLHNLLHNFFDFDRSKFVGTD